jgi:hypothetical protein
MFRYETTYTLLSFRTTRSVHIAQQRPENRLPKVFCQKLGGVSSAPSQLARLDLRRAQNPVRSRAHRLRLWHPVKCSHYPYQCPRDGHTRGCVEDQLSTHWYSYFPSTTTSRNSCAHCSSTHVSCRLFKHDRTERRVDHLISHEMA